MSSNEAHIFCNVEIVSLENPPLQDFIKELPYGFECELCSFESNDSSMVMSHIIEIHSKQILDLSKLHSDETQNIAAINPFKNNVGSTKSQAIILKDNDKKWLRPKSKKRKGNKEVSLLHSVLERAHLQYVAMSQENPSDHLQDFIKELPYGFECELCSFESNDSSMVMSHIIEIHSKQILDLSKLHSDETQNIAAINPFKNNVGSTKSQAIILKDNDKKWLRPKSKKRKGNKEVSLLHSVLERAHLQYVAMSQEFKREDEENKKRSVRKTSLLKIVLERTHHRSVAISQKFKSEDTDDISGLLNDSGIDTEMTEEPPKGKKTKVSDERIFQEFFLK